MSKHTPGPWTWDRDRASINYPGGHVAAVGEMYREQNSDMPLGDLEADAHLIKSAPDMYEALRWAIRILRYIDENGWDEAPPFPSPLINERKALELTEAAIAKARGKSEGAE